jgi:hypothetical protein
MIHRFRASRKKQEKGKRRQAGQDVNTTAHITEQTDLQQHVDSMREKFRSLEEEHQKMINEGKKAQQAYIRREVQVGKKRDRTGGRWGREKGREGIGRREGRALETGQAWTKREEGPEERWKEEDRDGERHVARRGESMLERERMWGTWGGEGRKGREIESRARERGNMEGGKVSVGEEVTDQASCSVRGREGVVAGDGTGRKG